MSDNKNEKKAPNKNPIRDSKKPDGEFDWSKVIKSVLSWGVVVIAAVIVMQFMNEGTKSGMEITFDQYEVLVNTNKISNAKVIKDETNNYIFEGTLKDKEFINNQNIDKFRTTLVEPIIQDQVKIWKDKNIKFTFIKESNEWMTLLFGIIPWILIIAVWVIFMRRMQGGGAGGQKGIFSFGKSKAKLISETQTKVTFNDVAGADEAKQELEEVIEFLKEPSKFQKLGGKIPRGVLLLGPPGTGKTLLARAVAGEAGVPFFSISGADFVEMFVGVGASRVRDLFDQGKKNAPCIVFIDEIDAVGRQRGAGLGGGHDEREQTLNALLVEMDGFEQNSGVIIIAATNRPDVLDPALLRPGRFDRQVVVDRPDVKGREGILKVHTRKTPLDESVKLKTLAKGTPGLSGAELANLVNEAALSAARKNKTTIDMSDFEDAKDKIMMGMERKSLIISETEKNITAYHEIGHVLVALKTPQADPVHKVTIIPRGRALGVTTYLPVDEKHTYSKEYLEGVITYALGGRAAEKIVFNNFTTGAGNDIEKATSLARKMVCEWGMSEKMGPISYGAKQEELFLGREVTKHQEFSEQTAQEIDAEVKIIVMEAMTRSENILKENMDVLHRLSKELLEREILDADEINKILNGEDLPPLKKNEPEEIPDHVKTMIKEKEDRKEEKTTDVKLDEKDDDKA
ncbi:MAG: ATP-dependent zinc metalloprotease FtsH [Bacteroidetes bacterium]|nr:ATP-dependent zinc metalloprotease FtsH [Bacteroidota bacterium]MBU1114023.1 ATP-dependent zinc metalloprotease FtsH [Bacteroidota bacterium]MBU1798961.1 ATP-dependent zinc metalloprotease FtsH [Bacteroidota bacterium]